MIARHAPTWMLRLYWKLTGNCPDFRPDRPAGICQVCRWERDQ